MAARDLEELLESAAPIPSAALDIAAVGQRARSRRRRLQGVRVAASLVVVGMLIGVAALVSTSGHRRTVVAGPPPTSRAIPIVVGLDVSVPIDLLDGTRINLGLPDSVGEGVTGATFANLALHGSVYAKAGENRGWRIDVVPGSIDMLVPGGEPLTVPSGSRSSAAIVDRPGHRLGFQFGSWALVASGDTLTPADIDSLLAGIALIETPDGFVEYRGSLPLWIIGSPDAALTGRSLDVSVFLRNCSSQSPQSLASGLTFERAAASDGSSVTVLCDPARRIEVQLRGATPLTDSELYQIRIDLAFVGPTLAAIQAGQHP